MASFDVSCPYCGEEQDICHDDGYGYDEGEVYSQECSCGKTFGFTTSISIDHDVFKVDCLNGADHDFKPTMTHPVEYTRMVCQHCDEERKPTQEELAALRGEGEK